MHDSICLVFIRLGPYHRARLDALSELLPTTAIELDASSDTYAWAPLRGPQKFKVLSVQLHKEPSKKQKLHKLVWKILDQAAPNFLCVSGWSEPGTQAAILWATYKKVPIIMMSDSQAHDFARNRVKEAIKRAILNCCQAGFVAGSRHVDYLVSLGMSREWISQGYDVVDNRHFFQGASRARGESFALRKKHDLPDHYFLACSRFVPQKNLLSLLLSYEEYRHRAGEAAWSLVILGDGPLRHEIEEKIRSHGLDAHVYLPGFKQYDELPEYYGLASAFIHASTVEPWGLVVNEAMAAGLPVLVSKPCGCVPELVDEGLNGYSFEPTSATQLAQLMFTLWSDPVRLGLMGEASSTIIEHWDIDRFVRGAQNACRLAQTRRFKRPSFLNRLLLTVLCRRA